jgi:hypothetical protein
MHDALIVSGRFDRRRRDVSVRVQRCEAVQLAVPVKALQLMDPGVLERQPRAVEDIHDGR